MEKEMTDNKSKWQTDELVATFLQGVRALMGSGLTY